MKQSRIYPKSLNHFRGFTLIELMVVVLIVGLLAGIIIVSVAGSRSKGRDARRKQDLTTIQTALENYANDNAKYPDTGGSGGNVSGDPLSTSLMPTYLSVMPDDPISNPDATKDWRYVYWSTFGINGVTYEYGLSTCMENQTSDGVSGTTGWCNGRGADEYIIVGGQTE